MTQPKITRGGFYHVYGSAKRFKIVDNVTGAIFVAPWLAAISDFDTVVEGLIICNWFIKTKHIWNMHLVVNT